MDAIDAHGKIEIKWDKDSLIIKDSGPGFEEPFMEKYLEPFFTTKDFGTGLGLPIAYNILKGHGVEIELKNENGGLVKLKFPD